MSVTSAVPIGWNGSDHPWAIMKSVGIESVAARGVFPGLQGPSRATPTKLADTSLDDPSISDSGKSARTPIRFPRLLVEFAFYPTRDV